MKAASIERTGPPEVILHGDLPDRGRTMSRRLVAVIVVLALTDVAGSRSPAQPPSPGQGRTGIFGLEATGNRFVYVFDRSASMGQPDGRPLDEARRELLASIDALGDSRQFHVIFYNDRLTMFTPSGQRGRPVFADDDTKREVRRFVESVEPDGGTRHYEAVAAALKLAPDAIFLLTDADESDDLTEDEFRQLSRSLGRARCMVVQFGGAEDRRSPCLARLAAESGGSYKVVATPAK